MVPGCLWEPRNQGTKTICSARTADAVPPSVKSKSTEYWFWKPRLDGPPMLRTLSLPLLDTESFVEIENRSTLYICELRRGLPLACWKRRSRPTTPPETFPVRFTEPTQYPMGYRGSAQPLYRRLSILTWTTIDKG